MQKLLAKWTLFGGVLAMVAISAIGLTIIALQERWVLLFSLYFLLGIVVVLQIMSLNKMRQYFSILHHEQRMSYRQLDSLLSLHHFLDLQSPLPPMREWAISPDFGSLLVSQIHQHRPAFVLETGSGVSTLVMGYALKKVGTGNLLSLEHDVKYYQISSESLAQHCLGDVATVAYAPLEEHVVQGRPVIWYATESLKGIPPIDMLVVDGPGAKDLGRYPALPILSRFLSKDAVIILDDAKFDSVRAVVDLWQSELHFGETRFIDNEKGAIILTRKREVVSSESGV